MAITRQHMYIGGGLLVVIIAIILVIFVPRIIKLKKAVCTNAMNGKLQMPIVQTEPVAQAESKPTDQEIVVIPELTVVADVVQPELEPQRGTKDTYSKENIERVQEDQHRMKLHQPPSGNKKTYSLEPTTSSFLLTKAQNTSEREDEEISPSLKRMMSTTNRTQRESGQFRPPTSSEHDVEPIPSGHAPGYGAGSYTINS